MTATSTQQRIERIARLAVSRKISPIDACVDEREQEFVRQNSMAVYNAMHAERTGTGKTKTAATTATRATDPTDYWPNGEPRPAASADIDDDDPNDDDCDCDPETDPDCDCNDDNAKATPADTECTDLQDDPAPNDSNQETTNARTRSQTYSTRRTEPDLDDDPAPARYRG